MRGREVLHIRPDNIPAGARSGRHTSSLVPSSMWEKFLESETLPWECAFVAFLTSKQLTLTLESSTYSASPAYVPFVNYSEVFDINSRMDYRYHLNSGLILN